MALGKKHSRYEQALSTLFGGNIPKKIPPLFDTIAECLAHPESFPEKVEEILEDEELQDIRIALARVQIDSELRMREDVEYFNRRLWVAQTIEKMSFGGLMVEGEKLDGDDEEDD